MKIAAKQLLEALPQKTERRTSKVLVSLTPTEKTRLNALAERMGKTPSALARELILGAIKLLEEEG